MEGTLHSTLTTTLNGSTTTTTTTVVVLTSLEVTLSALKDVVLHSDAEIGGAATTVVVPKASVTQVTSSTTSSVTAPFDCAGATTCHMQGSFRLSLDLARRGVVGGGESTNGHGGGGGGYTNPRTNFASLVKNGHFNSDALEGGANGGVLPEGRWMVLGSVLGPVLGSVLGSVLGAWVDEGQKDGLTVIYPWSAHDLTMI